jgi:hypothetical protein
MLSSCFNLQRARNKKANDVLGMRTVADFKVMQEKFKNRKRLFKILLYKKVILQSCFIAVGDLHILFFFKSLNSKSLKKMIQDLSIHSNVYINQLTRISPASTSIDRQLCLLNSIRLDQLLDESPHALVKTSRWRLFNNGREGAVIFRNPRRKLVAKDHVSALFHEKAGTMMFNRSLEHAKNEQEEEVVERMYSALLILKFR